jgi:hypothetical protein
MNIFYLDKCPIKSAQLMCDKHVVKMILESAQMLCTAHRVLDGVEYIDSSSGRKIKRWKLENPDWDNKLYHATHINHPSNIWVRSNVWNYNWLLTHMRALNLEFESRYNNAKEHETISKLDSYLWYYPKNIERKVMVSEPPICMDKQYVVGNDVIESYKNYYRKAKKDFATWKYPAVKPIWF